MNDDQYLVLRDKLRDIKVFLADSDGVMTTGHIFYAGEGLGFNRAFNVKDGFGIRMLKKAGIKVGIISGDASAATTMRSDTLNVDYSFLGNENKVSAYEAVLKDGYVDAEISYIGDEVFDIALLKRAGFSATVPSAPASVKQYVDYITENEGGMGCVREIIDRIMQAQGIDIEATFYA